MNVFSALVLICWLVFVAYWFVAAIGAKRNVGSSRSTSRRILIRIVAAVVILNIILNIDVLGNFTPRTFTTTGPILGMLGVILTALGVAFAIWARAHIGRNWGMPMSVKENPEAVTTGPYAHVRHPIYSGVLLAMLGSAAVSGAVWLVPFVIIGAYFIYSAKTEEKNMLKQFPEQYGAYLKRTKMLIPFVF